jgi:hypothetical protein
MAATNTLTRLRVSFLRGAESRLPKLAIGERRVAAVVPHSQSVLTSPSRSHVPLSKIVVDEVLADSGSGLDEASGQDVLIGHRSPAFAQMPVFSRETIQPFEHVLKRTWSNAPFAHEVDAQPRGWEGLQMEPTEPMLAFNMLRIPDADAYKQYSAHFSHFGTDYGMRFIEVASFDSGDPSKSVLSGSAERFGGYDLMALVYFPSSHAFLDAWSDPELATKAYPLRERMLVNGFEHYWARCDWMAT